MCPCHASLNLFRFDLFFLCSFLLMFFISVRSVSPGCQAVFLSELSVFLPCQSHTACRVLLTWVSVFRPCLFGPVFLSIHVFSCSPVVLFVCPTCLSLHSSIHIVHFTSSFCVSRYLSSARQPTGTYPFRLSNLFYLMSIPVSICTVKCLFFLSCLSHVVWLCPMLSGPISRRLVPSSVRSSGADRGDQTDLKGVTVCAHGLAATATTFLKSHKETGTYPLSGVPQGT